MQGTDLPAALKEVAPGGRLELVVAGDIDAPACAQVRQVLCRLQTRFGVQILPIKDPRND